jgi:hypothetical protein
MNSDIKIQLCKDDFYLMMRNAVLQSGGTDNLQKWKGMKLEELVGLFAQNGIRMTYMPEKHMDSIRIRWEDPRQPAPKAISFKDLQVASMPKKKQLLCDQMDRGDEEHDPICTD